MSCDRSSAASAELAYELLLCLAQIRILTTTRHHSSSLVGQLASSRSVTTAAAAQYRLACGCRSQWRAPLSLVRPGQPTGLHLKRPSRCHRHQACSRIECPHDPLPGQGINF